MQTAASDSRITSRGIALAYHPSMQLGITHGERKRNVALIIGIIIGALLVIILLFRLLGWIF
jgi:hypothetical protein